jgi:6-phosphogluconolactonase
VSELAILETAEKAAQAAADRVAAELEAARTARGRARVALAGGEKPRRCYQLLAGKLAAWHGVEVWFGDERAVGPDDPASNFRLAGQTLLRRASIPPEDVHRIEGERGAEVAADAYDALIREHAGRNPNRLLDVAFQGLGADAHTAALFPGSPAVTVTDRICVALHDAPKPPPERITLTIPILAAPRRIVFLVTGAEKRSALERALADPDPEVPASLLGGARTLFIADAPAAGRWR